MNIDDWKSQIERETLAFCILLMIKIIEAKAALRNHMMQDFAAAHNLLDF